MFYQNLIVTLLFHCILLIFYLVSIFYNPDFFPETYLYRLYVAI